MNQLYKIVAFKSNLDITVDAFLEACVTPFPERVESAMKLINSNNDAVKTLGRLLGGKELLNSVENLYIKALNRKTYVQDLETERIANAMTDIAKNSKNPAMHLLAYLIGGDAEIGEEETALFQELTEKVTHTR